MHFSVLAISPTVRVNHSTLELSNDVVHHLAVQSVQRIGQPYRIGAVLEGQLLVVEAKQIQDRSVQVVEINRVLTS